jgi:hypothetical protein
MLLVQPLSCNYLSIIVFFNLSQPLAGVLSASGFAINHFLG